jgi:hypothetical protein
VNTCTYGSGKNAVAITDLTFIQALDLGNANGPKADLCARTGDLLKEGVAALLNAQSPAVAFPESPNQIIKDVNAALATCDPQTISNLANQLDALNSARCPLSGRRCGTLTVPFAGN